ncbi:MAG: hypothetical protein AABW85_01540 [archaeon]
MKKTVFCVFVFGLFLFLSGCLNNSGILEPQTNPNVCPDSTQCKLVYDGLDCPACNKGDPAWICVGEKQAGLAGPLSVVVAKVTGLFSLGLAGNGAAKNCSCPVQELKYACSCDGGECKKVVAGKEPNFCRNASECESKNLVHALCAGGWQCVENGCSWACTGTTVGGDSGVVNPPLKPVSEIKDCGFDKECFSDSLLLCEKATQKQVNTFFRAGIPVKVDISMEVTGEKKGGYCIVKQTETGQTGSVKVSDCSYDGTRLIACSIVSNTG